MNPPTDQQNSQDPVLCPSCKQPFQVPDGVAANGSVACPDCENELTPEAILAAADSSAVSHVERSMSKKSNPELVSEDNRGATRAFDEGDYVIPQPLKTATRSSGKRPTVKKRELSEKQVFGKTKRRRSKTRKSYEPTTSTEVIKIIFGGLLALPLAQLILWWGFQKDPLQLAEPISKVIPFIVPQKMQAKPEIESFDTEEEINKDLPPTQRLNDFKIPKSLSQ